MKKIITGIALLASGAVVAQDNKPFNITGYVETYYSYYFKDPPPFVYSHNRHNEFNLNLGFIKAAYNTENVRANIAIAAGTYMNANYAAETGVLKNVYEANAGIKLSKKKNLWLDAGIFSSHIGFESAISKDCWTLTRSIVADNSPYYESGAKLTYTSDNSKWLFTALALNGWQRIKRVDGNSLMSFGTQVQFKPTSTTTLNYSTFIGSDKPDSARLMRCYHNLYAIFNVSSKLGVTAGVDIGMEQKEKGGSDMNTWYSPVLILKYSIDDKFALAARGEYYNDEHGVIIGQDFKTTGLSLNINYAPANNVLVRLEGRNIDDNTIVTTSLAINF
jgi:hypothetical protein